ncbi:hypothetical protein [Mycobacteroides abscessus]|uniref:hypothetical protein n=1 Tax=Mycobacteroides abscessus TaxID=36809 RepID=UPI0013000140|nr:hypothetical protein [Mycobacteroides abscessus]
MPVDSNIKNSIDESFPSRGVIVLTPQDLAARFDALIRPIVRLQMADPRGSSSSSPRLVPAFEDIADTIEYLVDRVVLHMLRPRITDARRAEYARELWLRLEAFRMDSAAQARLTMRDTTEQQHLQRALCSLYGLLTLFAGPVTTPTATIAPDQDGINRWLALTLSFFIAAPTTIVTQSPIAGLVAGGATYAKLAGMTGFSPHPRYYNPNRLDFTAHVEQLRRTTLGVDNRQVPYDLRVGTWNIGAGDNTLLWNRIADIAAGAQGWGPGLGVMAIQEVRTYQYGVGDPPSAAGSFRLLQNRFVRDQFDTSATDVTPRIPGWPVLSYEWTMPNTRGIRNVYIMDTGRQNRWIALIVDPRLRFRELIAIAHPAIVNLNSHEDSDGRPALGLRMAWRDSPDDIFTIYCMHTETGHGENSAQDMASMLATIHRRTGGRWGALGDFNTPAPNAPGTRTATGARVWATPVGMPTHLNPNDQRLDYMVADPSPRSYPEGLVGARIEGTGPVRRPDGTLVRNPDQSDHYAVWFEFKGAKGAHPKFYVSAADAEMPPLEGAARQG